MTAMHRRRTPELSVIEGMGSASAGGHPVTVVLADDHAVVRAGLRTLLTCVDWVRVVAETGVGGAVREAVLNRPDVLVLGRWHAAETECVLAELARCAPSVAVLVFSDAEDDESVFAALRAGARGCLRRAADCDDLLRALSAAAAGWVVLSPDIAGRLAAMLAGSTRRAHPFPELTAREFEVLTLVAAGLPNASIASELGLARKTISNHLSRVFVKLGVADRANAIVRARDAGVGVDRPI